MPDEYSVPNFEDCSDVCVPDYFNLHIPVNSNNTIIRNAYCHYSRILHPDKYHRLYRQHPPPSPPKYFSAILPPSWLPYLTIRPNTMPDLQEEHRGHALNLIQKAYAELYPVGGKAHLENWLGCGISYTHGKFYETKRDKVIHGIGRKPWFWEYEIGLRSEGKQFVSFGYFLLDNGEWKIFGKRRLTDWLWGVCERLREARGYGGEFLSGWGTIDEDYDEHWAREAREYTGILPSKPIVNSLEPKLSGIGISTNMNTNDNILWSERRSETDLRLLTAGDAEWEAAISTHVKQTGVLLLLLLCGLFLILVLWRVLKLGWRMAKNLLMECPEELQEMDMSDGHIKMFILENGARTDAVHVAPKDEICVTDSLSDHSESDHMEHAEWALKNKCDGVSVIDAVGANGAVTIDVPDFWSFRYDAPIKPIFYGNPL
ncbi:hypothetical protein BOTCAL_0004g00230 [Botryotinia calthae]|uniref:Uncharacterized protein n=1 Tax=Botryotinia calthae TaxID=38488 RepID=A0A4Y8DJR3_9HELO|nr:hypothetical protein BOTCAL_0004g00230 [Botryotinia calthae]